MPQIVLKPQPPEGVHVSTADGAYWKEEEGVAHIIVVGPMQGAPVDYENALNEMFEHSIGLNGNWVICHSEFMSPPRDIATRRVILHRGFYSLWFMRVALPAEESEGANISAADMKRKLM
jgi:hypothetical protein